MKFDNLGLVGLINDISPQDLQDGAFSNGQNIRFKDGYLQKIKGYSSVFGTPTVAPYWMLPIVNGATLYWVYCGLTKVYVTDGTTHTNITRQEPAPTFCVDDLAGLGAGNLSNGAYTYKVTFVNSNGETEAGTVSAGVTVVNNATDGQVALTVIPTGGSTVTSRKIYRTVADGSSYLLLATIADNTTTTYTDNIADGSLGAAAPSTNSADIDYSATALINWNGGFLSGIGIFNDGVDDPQVWLPATPATKLTSLTYSSGVTWAGQNYTAKVIRPFGNFLVALNITKTGTNYPYLVKWSHPAEAGTQPTTWDETDTTKDAGEQDIGDTGGILIDALELRDTLFIYKEDSVHTMRLIGGRFVFALKKTFKFGLLSRRCVKEYEGRHVVFSYGDVYVHDGQTANSIINKRMKNWLFDNIDPDNYETSFVVQNHQNNEFMFCFPQVGSTLPDKALIWNYRDDTFGTRDLPDSPHIAYGIVNDGVSVTINADSRVIDTVSDIINKRSYNPAVLKNLMASGTNLFLMDNTDADNGTAFTAYAERTSYDYGNDDIKFIKKVWPRVISTGEVTIRIGTQMNISDAIDWTSYTFNPNTDEYIPTLKKGRFISYYIGSTTDISWKTSQASFEDQFAGKY